jgi:8-oxo-dGTP pyrophosphatase MutT (NUDIX family)
VKLDFSWHDDRKREYCLNPDCRAETIERISEDGREIFYCRTCGQRNGRRIVVDPAMKWWIADDGEYWHESAGVFVRNRSGRFLFFERTVFPIGEITVPSGHVDAGELPEVAALRELREETGWEAPRVEHVASPDILGDSCRRGSDAHRWHAYLADFGSSHGIELGGEGRDERWLTLKEAQAEDLSHPVRYVIDRYAAELESMTP